MSSKIIRFLRNRDFILLFGVVCGLFLDRGTLWTQPLVLPALGVVMTLSTMGISGSAFRPPGALIRPFFAGVFMSYGVLSGVILIMGKLLIHDDALWSGFVILAAVPPAIAIIPFADFLGGNRFYALIGTMGGYLGGLLLMPFTALLFLRTSISNPSSILKVIIVLLVIPFVLSRVLIWTKLEERIAPYKGTITNWSFFLVVYTVVGLNQEHFFRNPVGLIPVVLIAVATTFILGFVIEWIGKIAKLDQEITTSLVLLGTLKNYGLAAGIALALFGKETALPATVSTIFMIIYIIWLNFKTGLGSKGKVTSQ